MQLNQAAHLTITVWLLFVGVIISGCARSTTSTADKGRSTDTVVTNNLRQIWFLLRDAMGESDSFPKTLAELNQPGLARDLFVCPGTGSRPGPMLSVEEWTDYIYVGAVWEGVPHTALVISPPENHGGKYGYAVCVDGYLARLPAKEIHQLIRRPWLLDTNAPENNLNHLKEQISIRVPKRLRSSYFTLEFELDTPSSSRNTPGRAE